MYFRSRKEFICEVVCTIIFVNRRFTEVRSHTAFVFIVVGAWCVLKHGKMLWPAQMYHISILAADTIDPNAYQASSKTTSVEMFPPVRNGLFRSFKITVAFRVKVVRRSRNPTMYLILSIEPCTKNRFLHADILFCFLEKQAAWGKLYQFYTHCCPLTSCLRNASTLSMKLYLYSRECHE